MIKRIPFLMIPVILLLSGSTMILSCSNGEEMASISRSTTVDDPILPDVLPFEYINGIDRETEVLVDNGMIYGIVQGSQQNPSIYIYYKSLMGDIFDEVNFNLGIDLDIDFYLRGQVLDEGEGESLDIFIWWIEREEPYRTYGGAVMNVGFDGFYAPYSADISICSFEYYPENVELFTHNGITHASMYLGDELVVFRGGKDHAERFSFHRYDHYYDVVEFLTFENDLMLYEQTTDGELLLSVLDDDLMIENEIVLETLPENIGFDSHLSSLVYRGDLFLFMFQDETFDYLYSDLYCIRLSPGLNIIRKGSTGLPDGIIPKSSLEPFIVQDMIVLIDARVENILAWDLDRDSWSMSELIPPDSYDMYDLSHSDDEIQIFPYQEQECLILTSGSILWGTSFIHNRASIPPMGSLELEGDWEIRDVHIEMDKYIMIHGNLSIINSEIDFTSGFNLYNYGNLVVQGSKISADPDLYIEIENHNNATFRDSDISVPVTNERDAYEMRIIGNNFDNLRNRDWLFAEGGEIEFTETVFKDLGSWFSPGKLPIQISRYTPSEVDIIMRDCTIENCEKLIDQKPNRWEMINCTVKDWDPYVHDPDDGMTLISGSTFEDCDEIVVQKGSMIINSTFTRGLPLQISPGCIVEGCSFNNMELAISDERAEWDPDLASTIMVRIRDSDFKGCEEGILLYDIYPSIDRCRFEGTNRCFVIRDSGSESRIMRVRNSTFESFQTAIEMMFDMPLRANIIIMDNQFGQGNRSIYLTEAEYAFLDLIRGYGIWMQIKVMGVKYKEFDHTFLDARNNVWNSSDPEEVAKTISPFIYFLPYSDTNGDLISTNDNDMDGMPDDWELNMGFDPDSFEDRYYDADFDFYTNYEEYREGTDPIDDGSNPTIGIRTRLIISEVIFILIPVTILICYIYYIQIARDNGKRKRFIKRYRENIIGRIQRDNESGIILPTPAEEAEVDDKWEMSKTSNQKTASSPAPEEEVIK